MVKKFMLLFCVGMLCMTLCGCFLLLAGAAGGAGTAVWLSGKLSQDVNASFDRTVNAARLAMKALRLEITKETVEANVAQIMGKYSDGKTIWIDVRRVTEASSKVEVRVGGVEGDQAAADKIIKAIQRNL